MTADKFIALIITIIVVITVLNVLFVIGRFCFKVSRKGWKAAIQLDKLLGLKDDDKTDSRNDARERSGEHADVMVARQDRHRASRRRRRSSMPIVDDDDCDALAAREFDR